MVRVGDGADDGESETRPASFGGGSVPVAGDGASAAEAFEDACRVVRCDPGSGVPDPDPEVLDTVVFDEGGSELDDVPGSGVGDGIGRVLQHGLGDALGVDVGRALGDLHELPVAGAEHLRLGLDVEHEVGDVDRSSLHEVGAFGLARTSRSVTIRAIRSSSSSTSRIVSSRVASSA